MANTGNTQQQINYGAAVNDGEGDPLRTAFIKTDDNFDNVWLAGPVGSNITITNNTIQANNTNGNLVLSPNGTGAIQTNSRLLPRLNNTYDFGSTTLKYRTGYFGAGGVVAEGNVTADYFVGNGSQLTGIAANYSNTNVASYLTTYTGNIAAGNIAVTNDIVVAGDVTAGVFYGTFAGNISGNLVVPGSNTWVLYNNNGNAGAENNFRYDSATDTLTVNGTANLVTVNATSVAASGNITGAYILGNGSALTAVTGANVTGTVANATYATSAGTASTAITIDGANVTGTVANAIYANSSGSATSATTAATVTTAAQPNITSVGTMVSLSATGNITGGNIVTAGNVSGAYIFGNGSQLTGITAASSYGNANVAAYLPTYTGQLAGNQLNITRSGNTWSMIDGALNFPTGALWYSDISTNDEFISSNVDGYLNFQTFDSTSNIATELHMEHGLVHINIYNGSLKQWEFNEDGTTHLPGDLLPQANLGGNLGSEQYQWQDLWVSNNTIYINSVPLTLTAGNVLTVNGEAVLSNDSNTAISTTGNITADYFFGDGSQLTGIAGSTGNLAIYGTDITINPSASETLISISPDIEGQAYVQVPNDATANVANVRIHNDTGNIELGTNSGASLWYFDNTGNLNLPTNGDVNFNAGGITQALNEDFYIRASDDENDGWSIYNVVDDGAGNTLAQTRLEFDQYTIRTDAQGAAYTWAFRDSGVLELPGDIAGNVGGNLTVRIGDQAGSDTFIDLQTRSYVGDALISNIRIANPNVTVSTANAAHNWTFGGDGTTQFPDDTLKAVDTLTIGTPNGVPGAVTAVTGSSGSWESNPRIDLATTGGTGSGLTVNVTETGGYASAIAIATPGTGYTNGDTISVRSGSSDATFTISVLANSWIFGTNGNLTLPGNTSSINYANGQPYGGSGGAGLPLVNGTSNFDIATANGNATVTTAGAWTWNFDTTGNLVIPNNIVSANTIDIDNRASGNTADIRLYSADDIVLQARDRSAGSTSEGGDINIYAGDSAEDGDSTGGDIQIIAGDGGAGNVDIGGSGGTVTIRSGRGGAAIGNTGATAEDGGDLTLQAGNAGDNNGNIDLGADGGDIFIYSGFSTGNTNSGGDIVLATGTGGQNGTSGNVRIEIPGYGLTTGGTWRFDATGNLTLPSNTFAVNYANGAPVSISGGGNASTGNVTFDDQIVIGTGDEFGGSGLYLAIGPTSAANLQYFRVRGGDNPTHLHFDTGNSAYYDQYFGNDGKFVKLDAGDFGNVVIGTENPGNSYNWTFDSDGNLTVPGNIQTITTGYPFSSSIANITTGAANVIVSLADNLFGGPETGRVTITDVVGTTEANNTWYFEAVEVNEIQLYSDAALENPVDGTEWTAYVSGGAAVSVGYSNLSVTGGNVAIITNLDAAWTFGANGNLTLPVGNIVGQTTFNSGSLRWVGNSSGDVNGYTTLELHPDDTIDNDGYLIIDPTAPNHIHIRAGGTQDNSSAQLYLGGENSYFLVENGANSNVYVASNSYQWKFDTTGNLTLPYEGVIQTLNDTVILRSVDTGTGNTVSARLGTNGALYLENTQYTNSWLNISTNSDGDANLVAPYGNINITPAVGITNAAGKSLNLRGGDADQSDFYTGAGGAVNITGGLGASNDGGGGGPGGSINLTAGVSSDPAGVAGNVNITSDSSIWTFDYTGTTTLPTVANESTRLVGTRKVIGGLNATSPYSVTLNAGGTPTVAYTSSPGTNSVKVTFALQSNGAGFQWEQFDVIAVESQDSAGTANFVVSNRVKSAAGIADTAVTVAMSGTQIQISLNLAAAQTSGGTASFDAVEFGLMVD
jgi:hypothetical protein